MYPARRVGFRSDQGILCCHGGQIKIKSETPRPGGPLPTKARAFQVALFYPDFGRVSSGPESHGDCTIIARNRAPRV
nr:MAG TPA_asm: hypothetical protein [Caudoviricetes sp.]